MERGGARRILLSGAAAACLMAGHAAAVDGLVHIPAGSLKRIFLTGKNNTYEGMVDIAEAHSQPANDETLARPALLLAKGRDFFLLSNQNIRAALDVFTAAQLEELPVIASASNPKIIGHASETHVLKRYAQALEKHEAEQQA